MPFGAGQGDPYRIQRFNFILRGLDLMHPVDNLEPGFYPYLKNVRAYIDGEIRTRPGITQIADLSASLAANEKINFIHYLTDPNETEEFCYIVGTTLGNLFRVSADALTTTLIGSGYSGSRFTAVVARPDRSPKPYLYLGDSLKSSKLKFDGTVQNSGIETLSRTPSVHPMPPDVLNISDFLGASPEVTPELGNPWNKSVMASTLTQVNRTNTTVNKILYDLDGSGNCCIAPVLFDNSIGFHQRLKISTEFTVVEQITNAIQSTTIEGIVYDAGATGACTIVLVDNSPDLVPNCLIQIDSELVRVEAVIQGPNNKFALKAQTTGTHAAGEAVVGYKSFRCNLVGVFTSGVTIVCKGFQSLITGALPDWGNIRHNAARDLSTINGRPIEDKDEITIGLYLSDPALCQEIRIWFDVDTNTTTSYVAGDMSRNYFMLAFRPSDLVQFADYNATNTQLQTTFGRIQRSALDEFNYSTESAGARTPKYKNEGFGSLLNELLRKSQPPPSPNKSFASTAEANSGKEQWYQLRFTVGQLKAGRVGSDVSKTLKDVKSIMVNFRATADLTVGISSWWIGGASGPSTISLGAEKDNSSYFYLTVPRNRDTGDEGLPSPPTRAGIIGLRQRLSLSIPMHPDTQVTNIDIYRYGGSLFKWFWIGSVPNIPDGGDVSFIDDSPDERIQFNRLLIEDNFAPFPTTDLPRRGTCDVIGSVVTRLTGAGNDNFNTKWSPGNEILINGKPFLLYSTPSSISRLELSESAGVSLSAEWEMFSPTLLATHLPILVGPFGYGEYGLTLLAAGDPLNPGWVYWTKGNSPGAASDSGYLELSPPTEPIIGGAIYDGRPYFYTSEREYLLAPNGQGGFAAQEVANSKGAVSPSSISTGTLQFHIGKDGIYAAEGGQPRSITDDRLYKLFPHDGQMGENVNGLFAPDYTRSGEFQLISTGDAVYFIFPIDSPASPDLWCSLRYDFGLTAWVFDQYGSGGISSLHYARGSGIYRILCGTQEGILGYLGGSSDDEEGITSTIRTPAFPGGNERARRRFGDLTVQANTNSTDTLVTPYTDNYQTSQTPATLNTAVRSEQIVDLNNGEELFGQTIGIEISHPGLNDDGFSRLELSEWQLAWIEKPERSQLRASDWDDAGRRGSKLIQGIVIEADTFGVDFPIRVEFDGGQLAEIITINHDGQLEKDYSFDVPFEAHRVRIRPSSTTGWRFFNVQWISEPTPASAKVWQTPETDHGSCNWKHQPFAYIAYRTSGADSITYIRTIDGVEQAPISLNSTNGEKVKFYLRLPPKKGKLFTHRFESDGDFSLYVQETCLMIGDWGRSLQEGYKVDRPFGGASRENGALI